MTPPSPKRNAQRAKRRRATKVRIYIISLMCAVVIGVVVTIAFAQPMAPRPAQQAFLTYLGVHEPDAPSSYAGVDQFAQAIGRQPDLVSYYSPWNEPFQSGFASSAMEHAALTLVQMDPMNVSLQSIASGQYDAYLRAYGSAVKVFGAQVVLSFGHEMNGNWYSWGNQNTSPAVFVAAWRHIVTIFRAMGAKNAIWLWTVNIVDNDLPIPIPDPAPWWPGSSYVNWVGIDGYYYNSSSTFSSIFGQTIVDVRRMTGDPILIAETGAESSAGQAAKIGDLFDGVRTYGLLGFIWFDENAEGHAWRINNLGAFAALRQDARLFLRPPDMPTSAQQGPSSSGPP